jgi:hypothetical protein
MQIDGARITGTTWSQKTMRIKTRISGIVLACAALLCTVLAMPTAASASDASFSAQHFDKSYDATTTEIAGSLAAQFDAASGASRLHLSPASFHDLNMTANFSKDSARVSAAADRLTVAEVGAWRCTSVVRNRAGLSPNRSAYVGNAAEVGGPPTHRTLKT